MRPAASGRSCDVGTPDSGGEFGGAACALGAAIDDYLAHGSVSLQNIRAVLVSRRGELLAERYYHSDAAAYAEIAGAGETRPYGGP